MKARRKFLFFVGLLVCSCCVVVWAARPALPWHPDSYAVHRMHTHHLSAVNHAHVLSRYNAQAIPREVYVEHINDIQGNVQAAAKTFQRIPAKAYAGAEGAEAAKAIETNYSTAMTSMKAMRAEVAKPSPNFEQVNTWATSLHQGLYRADRHLHGLQAVIGTSPIHKRLHPGATTTR